ncbi:antibiotic biosynthesis monooxygenase [Iodidimonas sp. SYSU 1G8]|uniref:putative quinol monooxygenase n=1 Tax=Iodidimonas sp. SYSU 1G8 TaxID=3133967 RepID=UPI0031FE7448
MIEMLIRLKVAEGKVEEFEALVAGLVADIYANEPDPKLYAVRKVAGAPRTYVYFISFTDKDAYDRYVNAPYHKQVAPPIMACLDGDPVYETLEGFY